jgi:peptidoglycan hydrolase-like protein with peptidoglycan-binding domain
MKVVRVFLALAGSAALVAASGIVLVDRLQGDLAGSSAPAEMTYRVTNGDLQKSVRATLRIEWERSGTLRAPVSGTVTELAVPTEPVAEGTVMASVDLAPVYLVAGEVPAFRALGESDPPITGRDVAQLQEFLERTGFYRSRVDGRYGATTADAIRRWQRSTAQTETGTVELGTVQFLPIVPARLVPTEGVEVGVLLSQGSPLFDVLADAPITVVELGPSPGQAEVGQQVVPAVSVDGFSAGVVAEVRVHEGGGAPTGGSAGSSSGTTVLVVRGADGGTVCAGACAARALTEPALLPVDIVVVPRVSGPQVPLAALEFGSGGQAEVTDTAGGRHLVTIVAEVDGMAIIVGIDAGTDVVVRPE